MDASIDAARITESFRLHREKLFVEDGLVFGRDQYGLAR
jgi:hypothetical protein